MSTLPRVLIVGATGKTGGIIADALLESKSSRVMALIRAESKDKPQAKSLQAAGVEIRQGDMATDSVEQLASALKGVDVLICTVSPDMDQRNILKAAKEAEVKRVVPSEFGPFVPKGLMPVVDSKLDVRDFIRELGLPYTFIHIGSWVEFMFPFPHSINPGPQGQHLNSFKGKGDKKTVATARKNIGKLVARIISDPRTLNQTVLAYDVEWTYSEAWKAAEKVTGEDFSDYPKVSEEDLKYQMVHGATVMVRRPAGYFYSLYIRGDSTVAKAVSSGILNARELYPDYVAPTGEEIAKEHYENLVGYELP